MKAKAEGGKKDERGNKKEGQPSSLHNPELRLAG
jgi:hypothetical protein